MNAEDHLKSLATIQRAAKWTMIAGLGLTAIAVIGGMYFSWYHAGLQAEVYRRQGAPMTQWEVFMGVKPIIRQIAEPAP